MPKRRVEWFGLHMDSTMPLPSGAVVTLFREALEETNEILPIKDESPQP